MSAALRLPLPSQPDFGRLRTGLHPWDEEPARAARPAKPARPAAEPADRKAPAAPPISLAFYRKHTERLLRRYLYASMQVGRAPSILADPVGRGWASSRPVRTFEDAVIFVLDVERCLGRLGALERQLLSRIVLQSYTQGETAAMLGMCVRTVSSRLALALDRLTEELLRASLLVIPE